MRPGSSSLPLAAVLAATMLTAAAPQTRAGDDTIQHWLDRMARAVETLNYRGTLVHIRDGHVDTLRIIHRADDNGVRERIYSLDGSQREVLRDGDKVRCLLPGDKPLLLVSQFADRLLPSLPVHRLISAESAYRMELGGTERVAGMDARVIVIEPRDEYRYGYRLWLEEQTGMLLRYALTDQQGRQIQQLSFTDIELGVPISDADLEPAFTEAPRIVTTTLDESRASGTAMSRASRRAMTPNVPDGFRLANAGHGRGENGEIFEHLLFSDGLASFSVYIENASADAVGTRVETLGPVHVYTAQAGGRLFTVVGEVPATTVEYVGRQLRRSGGPGGRPRR